MTGHNAALSEVGTTDTIRIIRKALGSKSGVGGRGGRRASNDYTCPTSLSDVDASSLSRSVWQRSLSSTNDGGKGGSGVGHQSSGGRPSTGGNLPSKRSFQNMAAMASV